MSNIAELVKNASQVVLIDYSWMLHRSFHAHNDLSIIKDGVEIKTGAIFGILRFVQSCLTQDTNRVLIFCKDGQTTRKEIFDGYKEGRGGNDLVYKNIDEISKMAGVPGVYFAEAEGQEADDVMASLALQSIALGKDTIVYSGDNDLLQLVSEGAVVSRKMSRGDFIAVDENYVKEKFTVGFDTLIYYRMLIGDTSDKIPPVFPRMNRIFARKFAELWRITGSLKETAQTLTKEYPALVDSIIEHKLNLKRNYELMYLLKYKEQPLDVEIISTGLDMQLLNHYEMNVFAKFAQRRIIWE